MHDVVVVGAGMTGLVCARQLTRAGLDVVVLEKSAGLGGRMATRRILPAEGGDPLLVDHGAQYITADTDGFHRLIKELLLLGSVTEWTRSLHILDESGLRAGSVDSQHPRYVCPQGMTAIAKHLAEGSHIRLNTRITQVDAEASGWQLSAEDGSVWTSKALVMALPAPQILALLVPIVSEANPLHPLLTSATYHPCLAVMAGYAAATPPPEWKGIQCQEDALLAWVALDSSKRVAAAAPVVVLHATPEFSATHLDADPTALEAAAAQILKHASRRLGRWLLKPEWQQVHRWRYSLPSEIVGIASLASRIAPTNLPLVCAGDWCGGAKVEGSWTSGLDAAKQVLGLLSVPFRET